MMLGRIAAASRLAAAPLRSNLAQRSAALRPALFPQAGAARNFAAVAYPKTLSIRMDGLMAKCLIAAVVYFVPQDIVFLSGLFWYWHTKATTIAPACRQPDAEAALAEFKAKKGLDNVKVSKGSRKWCVSI